MGRAASTARVAASSIFCGVSAWPSSARSAAVACTGVGATAASAMRAFVHTPLASVTCEPTPTTAMSSSRRGVWRRYAPPLCGPGSGTASSSSSSSGPSTVLRTPVMTSRSGTRRSPRGPAMTATASSASSGGIMSADGAALQMLPPTVARWRTCTEPTSAPLSASPRYCGPCSRGSRSSSRAVTAAPMRRPVLSAVSWRSGATPERSTTTPGLSRWFLSWGRRSVPPATSLAAAPCCCSACTHSFTLPGRIISNRRTGVSSRLREYTRSPERGHDLAREQIHRAQHARVLEVAEPERAVEVGDAHHVPHALDLTDHRVRRADDQEAVEQVVDVGLLGRRHRDGAALLHALVVVTQAERHAHVPARLLGGGARVGLVVGHVDRALHAHAERLRRLHLVDAFIEERAELAHALDGHAEAAGEHVEAAPHRRLDGIRALCGDPDRRPRLLQRLREDRGLRDLEELAVVRERTALEGQQEDVHGLLPPVAARGELQAEPLELVVLIAAPEADVDPAAGQQVERGDLLGDNQRMVQRHHDDRRPDPQRGRLGRDVGGELDGAREVAVGRKVVLGQPHVAEAERLGGLRHLDAAREDLLGRPRGGRLHQQEGPEVHDDLLWPPKIRSDAEPVKTGHGRGMLTA